MFEDFFNHKCNIFHIQEIKEEIGFGVKTQNVKNEYPTSADIAELSCHFHTESFSNNLSQEQPANKLLVTRKLSLPPNTDIRINDKVVDCDTGIEYTAQLPLKIRDHHIVVVLTRTSEQEIM